MTIGDIFRDGDPQDIVAGMQVHPKFKSDSVYHKSVSLLTNQTNRLVREHISGARRPEDLNFREQDLLNRIGLAINHFKVSDWEIPEAQLAETILFLASNPGDILQMQSEFSEVFGNLQDMGSLYQLRFSEKTTQQNVRKELLKRKPSIVHFSGHGIGSDNGFQRAGLVFESSENRSQADVMPAGEAQAMFKLIHSNAPLKLVLLNACESAEHARLISVIGCYGIGMTQRIKDTDAVRFAEGFYLGLANAKDRENPVPFAFASAVDHLPMKERATAKLFANGEEIKKGVGA